MALLSVAVLSGWGCGGGDTPVEPEAEVPPDPAGPPGAQILLDDVRQPVGSAVTLHGQGADPDCTALTYSWDLDGDGTPDSTDQSPTFTYGTAGEFDLTLTVTDASGASSKATMVVSIRDAGVQAPGVNLRCRTLFGAEGLSVHLVAVADQIGGAIVDYDWDFDGDGTTDSTTAAGATTFTYASAGAFEATVTANAAGGLSRSASLTLVLCRAGSIGDVGPSALIVPDVLSAAQSRTAGGSMDFRAFGSDIDGGACTYAWDLNGDSDFSDAAGRTATATWAAPGPVLVGLRVTDDEGRTTDAVCSIAVLPAVVGPDNPPEIIAHASNTLGSTGAPIQFQALGRDNEDGPGGLTYSWDFDGDGLEDDTGTTPTFTYTEVGTYVPECTVTDTTGNVARSYLTLIVDCCPVGAGVHGGGGPPPPPPPPGPYFWCDCKPVSVTHGASVEVPIFCPVQIGGSFPSEYQIVNLTGGLGFGNDPFAAEIDVADGSGGAVPPIPSPLVMSGPGNPPSFTVDSKDVDPPPRSVCYTITLRLRQPGVRTQILKCQVWIRHSYVRCVLNSGGTPVSTGTLVIEPPPVLPGPLAPLFHQVEVLFSEQTPPWLQVNGLVSAPPGWSAQILADRVQFFLQDPMIGNPIGPGRPPFPFQIDFQTTTGNPPTMGNCRFYDNQPAPQLIGQEQISMFNHTP